ncbi:DUF1127 domain-containing protein [Methylobacterium planeticum]|uniref:DUF1127 domain-containing protein n=1 Tax=Methylobacterium planeticum TaxID=2615211 RepID=A0A6N6MPY2_9HYPH|nr:DUF1127 domain-containing protein [Methylobacterium planeticum]KAB1073612.1 DUF1127 domain-containing protein [Methylobacterium planeticum]
MRGGAGGGASRAAGGRLGRAGRLRHGLAGIAAALARFLARLSENRRLLAELGAMSERELRDIGLTRQDAADAAQLHPAEDVGGLLAARRAERRAARRVRCGTGAGVTGGGALG